MAYIDGFVLAVPTASKDKFIAHANQGNSVFIEQGATRAWECWGDDVPDGKLTSFPLAVKREADESVIFSWIEWPSRAARDAGMAKVMADPAMQPDANPMPFDGKRVVFGGFQAVVEA